MPHGGEEIIPEIAVLQRVPFWCLKNNTDTVSKSTYARFLLKIVQKISLPFPPSVLLYPYWKRNSTNFFPDAKVTVFSKTACNPTSWA